VLAETEVRWQGDTEVITNPTTEQVLDHLLLSQCLNYESDYLIAEFETHCEGTVRIAFKRSVNGTREYLYVEVVQ